jgi:AAA+ superfamily predicted ATPase
VTVDPRLADHGPGVVGRGDESLRHLRARVALVEDRIRQLVAHRRAADPAPDDPFRGLYLSDEMVDHLLAGSANEPDPDRVAREDLAAEAREQVANGATLRLLDLARAADLNDLDVELLVVALLPDLDSRVERFYGYLNDDVTRRRATIGLALDVAGVSASSASARARLLPGGPLVDSALVQVEDADRPFLTRALRVPDRVSAHLLGNNTPDPALVDLLDDVPPLQTELSERLGRALTAPRRLAYIRERGGGVGIALGAAAIASQGRPVLAVNTATLRPGRGFDDAVAALRREALLQGAGVVAGSVETLTAVDPDAVRRFADLPVPMVLVGTGTWDPMWTRHVPLLVDAPALTPSERRELWLGELARRTERHQPGSETRAAPIDGELTGAGGTSPAASAVPEHFVLGPQQVARAVVAAEFAAALRAPEALAAAGAQTVVQLEPDDLRRGARTQNAAGLERLARRVEPAVDWDDIVLPPNAVGQLHELSARARHRDQVLVEWRMRPGAGRGRGVTALFAGDSGTGKTMAAEVIAGDLGLDLYTVNLATVVDKYIGETEKNLERIFAEAGGVNAVLLFDEADAIFGKRSEVRDAHDRYANIESAYLLQRMETFDGLAVLSTNLRANIDDAFTRRLDMIVDFPAPDEKARLAIWERCLVPPVPTEPDLDLEFCARSFTLSGGNIRSAATTAAYLAAAAGGPIGMSELIAAVQQEYRKLGRLVLEREFGHYLGDPSNRSR